MKKKTIALALVLVMVFGATLGGTFAYLTSTDTVTNTFTVGNVKITMDEAKVNPYGEPVDKNGKTASEVGEDWTAADRVKANEYKLLPGHTYTKDPTIYVDAKSEDAWLFVKVENGIAAIEDTTSTIVAQLTAQDWQPIAAGSNIYARTTVNKAGDTVKVFESFKISGTANIAGYATEKDATTGGIAENATNLIKITAYAIQADGFATAEAAWAAYAG